MKPFVSSKVEAICRLIPLFLGVWATFVVASVVLSQNGYHIVFNLVLGLIALGVTPIWGYVVGDLAIRAFTRVEIRYESVYVKRPFRAGCEYYLRDMIAATVHTSRRWSVRVPSRLVLSRRETFHAHNIRLPILGAWQTVDLMNALVERIVATDSKTIFDVIHD